MTSSPTNDPDETSCRVSGIGNEICFCEVPPAATYCRHRLPFGYGYLCRNPRRENFVRVSREMGSSVNDTPSPDELKED